MKRRTFLQLLSAVATAPLVDVPALLPTAAEATTPAVDWRQWNRIALVAAADGALRFYLNGEPVSDPNIVQRMAGYVRVEAETLVLAGGVRRVPLDPDAETTFLAFNVLDQGSTRGGSRVRLRELPGTDPADVVRDDWRINQPITPEVW